MARQTLLHTRSGWILGAHDLHLLFHLHCEIFMRLPFHPNYFLWPPKVGTRATDL